MRESEKIDRHIVRAQLQDYYDRQHRVKHIMGYAMPTHDAYKVEVIADTSGQWVGNGLLFFTRDEAEDYARNLFARWTACRDWRVVTV